ncbi:MAG: hypothetical protein A3G24_23135 [Betaproteobacteria bacterium RIFCSPLOWO2_12_FULL_62_13]|nr:MAG: hypothetical protein A3G24_23135 [Betaproteobacteria bacterium RIFCSPLOWO2_12_FULL_62_13]
MVTPKSLMLLILGTLLCSHLTGLAAQDYPIRPIRLVVPSPPGGAVDLVGRIIAQKLADNLGQNVIVDNRPGAGQSIAPAIVARAAPDGYTLLEISITHTINPGLDPKLPFDSVKDFSPISLIAMSPLVLVVHPSLPVKSVKDFIALAKARPGQLNFGASNGSGGHLALELFGDMTNINIVHVPYRGGGPALIDLMAGRVQLMMTSPLTAVPLVRNGKLRLLGVSSKARSPALPDVPTIAETVQGYEASLWYALLAPAGTPANIIRRLNSLIQEALTLPDVRELFSKASAEPMGSTPDELGEHISREIEKWRRVIKAAGMRRG